LTLEGPLRGQFRRGVRARRCEPSCTDQHGVRCAIGVPSPTLHIGAVGTHFAPAERATLEQLRRQIDEVATSPVVDAMLLLGGGIVAVLNAERQILAVNTALLDTLGCRNASELLGLRPGEAAGCVNAHLEEGGCGTSEMCATCGAAIAIVSALATEKIVERTCALEANRDGVRSDMFLRVRAALFKVGDSKLIFLWLQDITQQQHWTVAERLFIHDVSNVITALAGDCAELAASAPGSLTQVAQDALRMSNRLASEIAMQRALLVSATATHQAARHPASVAHLLRDLSAAFARQFAAEDKWLVVTEPPEACTIETDSTIALRVLGNMVTNALEATEPGGKVRVDCDTERDLTTFRVWNDAEIPPAVQRRIFQRNFSTKSEPGRGIGTYSMKLFGERVLGGQVSFTSDASGTTFRFSLPVMR
jgi:signal transduction histidine kinase